jgi:hypothetical protein
VTTVAADWFQFFECKKPGSAGLFCLTLPLIVIPAKRFTTAGGCSSRHLFHGRMSGHSAPLIRWTAKSLDKDAAFAGMTSAASGIPLQNHTLHFQKPRVTSAKIPRCTAA